MKLVFVECLEARQFLSAAVGVQVGLFAPGDFTAAPLAAEPLAPKVVKRMPRVGDVFKGYSKWREGGKNVSVHITMKVTKAKNGEYTVLGTSSDDRTARYTYKVHLKSSGALTFEFTGRNYYGSDTGSGSGRLSGDGKTLSGKNTSSQNTGMVTFSLTRQ
jgi:hypothetical protein